MSRQQPNPPPHPNPLPQGERGQVKIVGAGLAGAACASAFAHVGYSVTVYEQDAAAASGASGVPIGMFAPSVSADDAPHSRLLRQGVHKLVDELRRLTNDGLLVEGADWAMTGVLERCIRGNKKLPGTWLAPQDPQGLQSRVLGESSTTWPAEQKAVQVQQIWHPMAGWVNPSRLIAAWLSHPSISLKTEQRIDDLSAIEADVVVVACGYQIAQLLPHLQTTLQAIRGQVEWGDALSSAGKSYGIRAAGLPAYPINGMGHFIQTPTAWLAGATFQRDEADLQPCAKDVDLNFEKLAILMPQLAKPYQIMLREESTSWAGVRAAQKNRQPLVQKIESLKHANVWVCAGLGSRGLSLAALCAEQLCGRVLRISSPIL